MRRQPEVESKTSTGRVGKVNLVFSLRPALPLAGRLLDQGRLPRPWRCSQLDQQDVSMEVGYKMMEVVSKEVGSNMVEVVPKEVESKMVEGSQPALHIATSNLFSSSSLAAPHFFHLAADADLLRSPPTPPPPCRLFVSRLIAAKQGANRSSRRIVLIVRPFPRY